MCGIAGLFGRGRIDIEAMLAAMRHRGPDDRGVLRREGAILGMTRLAIIDLGPTGHQPMLSPDGEVAIVFNGEIYNYREERAALLASGRTLRSTSDTEIVLELYLRDGLEFARRLRGMFAIAVLDRRGGPGRERLVLARDHFGIKPLLHADTAEGGLVFASELKALLASGAVSATIDPIALGQLVQTGSVGQPRTMLQGVAALPAGSLMVVEGGRRRTRRFWRPGIDRVAGLRAAPYAEQRAAVAAALEDSLERQLVADVPVGAFLSGGIDSALLVALMARRHGAVRTFSVGFPAAAGAEDETDDAALVARHLGTAHRRIEVTEAGLLDRLGHLAAALDQPSVDGINSYFVSAAAAGQVKVALSGTGGDELFAGYPWFAAMRDFAAREAVQPARAAARRGLAALSRQGVALADRWQGADFLGAYAAQFGIFAAAETQALLAPALRGPAAAARLDADYAAKDDLAGAGAIERTTALCLATYTRDQLLRDIDAMSMAQSLEVRVPFLDPVLADVALSLPDAAKLGPGDPSAPEGSYAATGLKRVLLDLGRELLPPGLDRRRKRGFALPFAAWLRGGLAPALHDCLSPDAVTRRGWFEPDAVAAVLGEFESGRAGWPRPWLLMMAELWARQVVDPGRPA